MAVVRTWSVRCQPGQFDEAVAFLGEGAKLLERHGARDTRLTQGRLAGTGSDALVLSCEFDDYTSYGTFADEVAADQETISYMGRVRSATAPYVLSSAFLLVEVPLGRTTERSSRGTVLQTYMSRPLAGRLDDALTLAREAFDVLERVAATRCRLLQIGPGGEYTGHHVAVIEFDSMAAFGRANDAFAEDDRGRSVVGRVTGTESPIVPVASSVYVQIAM